MTKPRRDTQELVRDSLAAVREVLSRSHLYKAWDLLQERDSEGNSKGALPYTDHALVELAAAHECNPDDIGIVHHLAIAYHARAWDMELNGDPQAASEWEHALDYWRAISASSVFWNNLRDKSLACNPDANPAWLAEVRQNLLENLLDIHVDFVRYYCEADTPERAIDHVGIVQRTRLPPAIKKRLIGKVFDAMTSAIPEARAARAYASVLTSLERFLVIFPDYLPALRLYAEICREDIATMSHNWDDIMGLGVRAEPHMRRLASYPELGNDPLAQTALEELTGEFALRGSNQGDHYVAAGNSQPITQVERDAACSAYEFSIRWGHLGYPLSPGSSQVRMIYAACLNDHASLLYQNVTTVSESNTDLRTKLRTIESLLRLAVADLEEAVRSKPGDEALESNLQALSESLAEIESKGKLFDMFNDLGDQQ